MKNKKLKSIILLSTTFLIGGLALASCDDTEIVTPPSTEKAIVISGAGDGTISIGTQVTLTASDNEGNALSGVRWSSNDSTTIIVDSALGVVTPLKIGSATITCSLEGYTSASVTLIVIDPSLESLTISANSSTSIYVNQTLSLVASANGSSVSGVTWSSANSSIASVTTSGVVTGRGLGTTRITAVASGYNPGYIDITVIEGEPLPEEYAITFRAATGVTFNYEKDSAVSGQTVTFTVTINNEDIVLDRVTLDGENLTPNNGTYSFVMPTHDVTIRAYTSVNPDINTNAFVSGEASIPLVYNPSTGLYEAHEVSLTSTTQLNFNVRASENESFRALSYQDFDFYHCFADIETARNYTDYNFQLPGGFTYSFYYDPLANDHPARIVRTSVDVLPSSEESLSSLFDGGKSTLSTYPENVKSVSYTNSASNESYSFTRYRDNKSLAIVNNLGNGIQKAVVYKSLDNDVYTYVDTYVESGNDATKNYDTTQKSGHIDVFDTEDEARESKWRMWTADEGTSYPRSVTSRREALFDANHYSHDMNSLEFDIMYAYRVGYASDYLQSSNISISSIDNNKGTFTTTIDSRKTLVDASNNLYEHYEYDVTLTFNSDGSILSGKYLEKVYGTADYNFASDNEGFLTGGEERGSVVKKLTFAYTYDENLDAMPTFHTSSYFISSLTNIRVNNSSINSDASKNVVKKGDIIERDGYLTFDFAPSTALDSWQYDITASSNEAVIGTPNSSYQYRAIQNGTSTLTIGNRTENTGVSSNISVDVQSTPARSVYFDTTWSGYTDDLAGGEDDNNADQVCIYEGRVSKATLRTSPPGSDNSGLTFTPSNPALKVSYDPSTELITFDATELFVEGSETITLTVDSNNWEEGITGDSLRVKVIDASALTMENIVGDWAISGDQEEYAMYSSDMNLNFTSTEYEYDGEVWYRATYSDNSETLNFIYKLNNAGMPQVHSLNSNASIRMIYDTLTERIGFIYYTSSWEGEDSTSVNYIVGGDDGDEDYTTYYGYFAKKA